MNYTVGKPKPQLRYDYEYEYSTNDSSVEVINHNHSYRLHNANIRTMTEEESGDGSSNSQDVIGYLFLFSSLVCLGTWPAFLRRASIAKKQPHEIAVENHRRCNHPQLPRDVRFAYLDYAFSYVIASLIPLWIELGHRDDSGIHLSGSLIGFACLGGLFLSAGNISLQWATTVYQAPLTTVVAIQASFTVVLGTLLNALLERFAKTPRPIWLVVGVGLFLVAIGVATKAHAAYSACVEHESALNNNYDTVHGNERDGNYHKESSFLDEDCKDKPTTGSIELQQQTMYTDADQRLLYGSDNTDVDAHAATQLTLSDHCENNQTPPFSTKVAEIIIEQSTHSSYTMLHPRQVYSRPALILAILGGCSFGFFSPAFNVAVNDPFRLAETGLSVPTANLWFSVAFTLSSIAGTWLLWRFPPRLLSRGTTTTTTMSLVWEYANSLSPRNCSWGVAAGMLCGMGNLLQFRGGRLVGFATADLVQAYPLVSTLWDVYWFGEYTSNDNNNNSNNNGILKTYWYLMAMYLLYLGGILCIIKSSSAPSE